MNIFVTSNDGSTQKETALFTKAIELLKLKGHNVFVDKDFSSQDYFKSSHNAFRNASIVIAEVTNIDAKLGIEISKALADKKIVIALHSKTKLNQHVASLAKANKASFILVEYSKENIEKNITTAFEEAKKLLDTKFILIISPEIDQYLTWASENKRMHKAQVVRDAIEKTIIKDKEYKKSLSK